MLNQNPLIHLDSLAWLVLILLQDFASLIIGFTQNPGCIQKNEPFLHNTGFSFAVVKSPTSCKGVFLVYSDYILRHIILIFVANSVHGYQ